MINSVVKSAYKFLCGDSRSPTLFHPEWYTRLKHKQAVVKASKKYICGKTLDVGSGDRYYEKLLKGTYSAYVALDKIEYWGSENTNPAPDIAGDAVSIPTLSHEFDSILLVEVLEHCFEYEKILNETNRVLKIDGYILITVPFLIWVHGSPFDYFRYTRHALSIIIEQSGYSIVEINNICGAGGVVAAILNSVTSTTEGFSKTRKFFHIYCLGIILPFFWLIANLFAVIFDRIFKNPNYPFGYIIIARKKGSNNYKYAN
jgi:SAM-dependent methyltransferase